eukprot:1959990-Rhodomonas_salina.2
MTVNVVPVLCSGCVQRACRYQRSQSCRASWRRRFPLSTSGRCGRCGRDARETMSCGEQQRTERVWMDDEGRGGGGAERAEAEHRHQLRHSLQRQAP